jgi:hypothetical protein
VEIRATQARASRASKIAGDKPKPIAEPKEIKGGMLKVRVAVRDRIKVRARVRDRPPHRERTNQVGRLEVKLAAKPATPAHRGNAMARPLFQAKRKTPAIVKRIRNKLDSRKTRTRRASRAAEAVRPGEQVIREDVLKAVVATVADT